MHDELGAILLDILRCVRVENIALLFVRVLPSEQKSAMVITGHLFSAKLIFDSLEFDAHHMQGAGFDAAGNLENRELLIIRERSVELVYGNIDKFFGNTSRTVVANG